MSFHSFIVKLILFHFHLMPWQNVEMLGNKTLLLFTGWDLSASNCIPTIFIQNEWKSKWLNYWNQKLNRWMWRFMTPLFFHDLYLSPRLRCDSRDEYLDFSGVFLHRPKARTSVSSWDQLWMCVLIIEQSLIEQSATGNWFWAS